MCVYIWPSVPTCSNKKIMTTATKSKRINHNKTFPFPSVLFLFSRSSFSLLPPPPSFLRPPAPAFHNTNIHTYTHTKKRDFASYYVTLQNCISTYLRNKTQATQNTAQNLLFTPSPLSSSSLCVFSMFPLFLLFY